MYCKECGAEIEEGEICKECKWKLEVKQTNSFTKDDGVVENPSNNSGFLKRKHNPLIAIIIGYFIAGILIFFVPSNPISPNNYLLDILAILILILGGFTATYISRTNKAIYGFYEGLLFSISILPSIFIFKTELTFYLLLNLTFPIIFGLVGGFIGKILRSHMDE